MNLLEAFVFTFAGDAKSLDEALATSKKGSKELEDSLQQTDKVAAKLGEEFMNLARKGTEAFGAFLALGALKKLTMQSVDATFAVRQQAVAMSMSVSSLSAYQNAVRAMGGNADDATKSLSGLRDKFVEMARYGGIMNADSFMLQKLGVSRQDQRASVNDPTIAMRDLAGTFEHLNATQRQFVGQKLGFDQGTIALLSQGRRGFDEIIDRQTRLGVVTKAQAENAAEFKMAQAQLNIEFETSAREITGAVVPAITWLFNEASKGIDYLRDHKTVVLTFFTGIGVILADTLIPSFVRAAIATWAWLAPIIAGPLIVAALVAAFAILFEDVQAFMAGHDSAIGSLAKKWPQFGAIVRSEIKLLISEFKTFMAIVGDAYKYIVNLFQFLVDVVNKGPSAALDLLNKKTGALFKDIKAHLSDTGDAIVNTGKALLGSGNPALAPTGASRPTNNAVEAAQEAEKKYGVPAAVTLAQYQLESGSGKHMPTGSNNPFGIKANAAQIASGSFVNAMTTEVVNGQTEHVMQKFAKFDSLADAFDAHAKLLATGKAYANARKHTDDPNAYADALTGKYATDPQYGAKLKQIIMQQRIAGAMDAGHAQLATANAPIASQSSSVIANSIRSRGNTSVSMGDVNVHTASDNGKGIAGDVGFHLQSQLKSTVDYYDDGITI